MEEPLDEIQTHRRLQTRSLLQPPAEDRAEPLGSKGYRRVTLNLPADLVEQLRNTVYWTPGVTLTGLIKDALHESLERLEQRNGRRYPTRLGELKSGRPRKVRNGSRHPSSQFPADRLSEQGFHHQDRIGRSSLVADLR
ncbi:MAG TPA: hypothetical protein VLA99_16490 [Nitrospiraceae bacterium]|nr:hypothetical protein [Nitrospiraceae bacterium]